MLNLEYTLTEEEFLNYNYYVCWKDPAKKLKRVKFYATMLICFILLCIIIFSQGDKGILYPTSIISMATGIIVLLLLFRFRLKALFDKQAKKTLEQSGRDTILATINLTINENGLFGKTKVAEVKYSWNAFQRKVIVNNCYYLYVNARQAMVIPFSAFPSPAEKEKFDALLLQYLPLKTELKHFA